MTNHCRSCNGSRASREALHTARDLAALALLCAALAVASIVGAVWWAGDDS